MRTASRLVRALVVGAVSLGATLVPTVAQAAPGSCTCNSGCHEAPGMCLNKVLCGYGYVPSCGYRASDDSGLPVCPKVGYLSCDGTCTCVPIPGFCDTVGDADYCDSGPKDSAPPDTTVTDSTTIDSTLVDSPGSDTSVSDTSVSDSSVSDSVSDTAVPPDVPVSDVPADSPVDAPIDTAVPPDAPPSDTPDTCVPAECPPATKAIPVPGACDPFCAQPCAGGEFGKCPGLVGTECKDGFCLPKCLITPCAACLTCSLGTGTCYDDGTLCPDGGADGGTDGATGDGAGGDGADDGSTGDGAGGDGSSVDGDLDGSLGDGGDLPPVDAGNTGGCGCSIPGGVGGAEVGAIAAAAALLVLVGRRRPRKRS